MCAHLASHMKKLNIVLAFTRDCHVPLLFVSHIKSFIERCQVAGTAHHFSFRNPAEVLIKQNTYSNTLKQPCALQNMIQTVIVH